MKKVVLLFALFSLMSCEKDDTSNIESSGYYVRYDVSCRCNGDAFRSSGRADLTISYTGGSSVTVKNVASYTWTTTKGPFKKGAGVSLTVTPKIIRGTSVTTNASISVSKDGGPFVTKASKNSTGSISYNIK